MEDLKKFYKDLNKKHGNDVKACGWTNEEKCLERYEQGIVHIKRGSVMEIGCGNGFFLDNFNFKYDYIGLEKTIALIKKNSLQI